jgi:ribonuclease HII
VIVAGIDEVGRGSIAGPLLVVAAAFEISGLTNGELPPCGVQDVKDSKMFSSRSKRERVSVALEAFPEFLGRGRGVVTSADITVKGMSWAIRNAFYRAVLSLPVVPDILYVDGDSKVAGWSGPQEWGSKGDMRWWPCAAASILAKVERDRWMDSLSEKFPGYGWEKNSGYGTASHFTAIRSLGITPIHRMSFVQSHLNRSVSVE